MSVVPKKGLVALFKRGWHEIPEVMGSFVVGFVGLGIGCFAVYNYYQKDGDNRRYKTKYTVLRHDDPRVIRIRCD